jgi:hypothetical protein
VIVLLVMLAVIVLIVIGTVACYTEQM